KPQRERVGGIVGEDGFPDRKRAVEVAGSPGVKRLHMGLLARRRLGHQRTRSARRLAGRRHTALLVEHHGEIALEPMRPPEPRLGCKRARQMSPRIEAELEKT